MKQYIDKAALVAEIEKRRKEWSYGSSIEAKYKREECDDFLSFLDILEVKEEPISVDLANAAIEYCGGNKGSDARVRAAFVVGAYWLEEHLICKMEQFLYEELSNGDIECRDMKSLIEYFKSYMKEN